MYLYFKKDFKKKETRTGPISNIHFYFGHPIKWLLYRCGYERFPNQGFCSHVCLNRNWCLERGPRRDACWEKGGWRVGWKWGGKWAVRWGTLMTCRESKPQTSLRHRSRQHLYCFRRWGLANKSTFQMKTAKATLKKMWKCVYVVLKVRRSVIRGFWQ